MCNQYIPRLLLFQGLNKHVGRLNDAILGKVSLNGMKVGRRRFIGKSRSSMVEITVDQIGDHR